LLSIWWIFVNVAAVNCYVGRGKWGTGDSGGDLDLKGVVNRIEEAGCCRSIAAHRADKFTG
jgi:hypothetical protein